MKAKVWAKAYLEITEGISFNDRLGWLMAISSRQARLKLSRVVQTVPVKELVSNLDMPEPIAKYLKALFESRADHLIAQIYELVNEGLLARGIGQGIQVLSAQRLSASQLGRFEGRFKSKVLIENIVKPGLLGGVQVRTSRQLIDKTFQSNLVQLQEALS